jgi:hypothetical protein
LQQPRVRRGGLRHERRGDRERGDSEPPRSSQE